MTNIVRLPVKQVEWEYHTTRDAVAPVSADDPEMENGWQCIPLPPTADPDWEVHDSSKDNKTVWRRRRSEDAA